MSSADLMSRKLIFKWNPVGPNCPAIKYKINASNCGSCLQMTRSTEVTCYDIPNNHSQCRFAVQTFTCNHTLGNWSDTVSVNLTGVSMFNTLPRGLYANYSNLIMDIHIIGFMHLRNSCNDLFYHLPNYHPTGMLCNYFWTMFKIKTVRNQIQVYYA